MALKPLACVVAVLTAASSVFAADPVDVSPLVNDRTVAVAQIDLDQIKLRPAFDWAIDTAKRGGVPQEALTQIQQGAAAVALMGQPSVDGLRRAGVPTLAVVVQLNDNLNSAPILLLAVPKPANPKAVTAALGSLGMRSGEKGNLMVFSPNLPPGVLAKMQPADRPDLAVKTGGSALVGAVALSAAAKADVMATMTPNDREGEAFVRDVKRYEVRIDTAGGPHINAVAEAESPDAAAALKDTITKERPGREGKVLGPVVKALPLSVDGSNLVLSAGQAEIDAFAKAAVPAVSAARQQAVRTQSMSNMRQLMTGSMLYANDHKGQTPVSLDDVSKYVNPNGNGAALFTNPQRPELGKNGYVYVRAAEKIALVKNPATRVAIYEAGDFGDGINVAFWDGHVEQITDEAKFKAMLGDAAATQPAP